MLCLLTGLLNYLVFCHPNSFNFHFPQTFLILSCGMCHKQWIRLLLVGAMHFVSSWYDPSRLTGRNTSSIVSLGPENLFVLILLVFVLSVLNCLKKRKVLHAGTGGLSYSGGSTVALVHILWHWSITCWSSKLEVCNLSGVGLTPGQGRVRDRFSVLLSWQHRCRLVSACLAFVYCS